MAAYMPRKGQQSNAFLQFKASLEAAAAEESPSYPPWPQPPPFADNMQQYMPQDNLMEGGGAFLSNGYPRNDARGDPFPFKGPVRKTPQQEFQLQLQQQMNEQELQQQQQVQLVVLQQQKQQLHSQLQQLQLAQQRKQQQLLEEQAQQQAFQQLEHRKEQQEQLRVLQQLERASQNLVVQQQLQQASQNLAMQQQVAQNLAMQQASQNFAMQRQREWQMQAVQEEDWLDAQGKQEWDTWNAWKGPMGIDERSSRSPSTATPGSKGTTATPSPGKGGKGRSSNKATPVHRNRSYPDDTPLFEFGDMDCNDKTSSASLRSGLNSDLTGGAAAAKLASSLGGNGILDDMDGKSELTEDGTDGDAELMVYLRMEGAVNAEDVLKVTHSVIDRLQPETIIAALHMAARHINTSPCGREISEHKDFSALLHHLSQALLANQQRPQHGRALFRLVWTLGKFELRNKDSDAIISHVCGVAHNYLHKGTPHDLTNTLWGLARMFPGRTGASNNKTAAIYNQVIRLASLIVSECSNRIGSLTAQCLSNSMWSIARLRLKSPGADSFINGCLQELQRSRELRAFTPQGLANTLWAVAELRALGMEFEDDPTVLCTTFSLAVMGRIHEFQSQELSMFAWAIAKIHGRSATKVRKQKGARGAAQDRSTEVDAVMIVIAQEAQTRLGAPAGLGFQSVSNIAWAVATLELVSPHVSAHKPVRNFLFTAAATASKELSTYSPQSVANLLWAVMRLEPSARLQRAGPEHNEILAFATACAKEATHRMREFSWRDLAGIAVALAHCHLRNFEALNFATLLVEHMAPQCNDLTPQAMLNIAQAAARLQVSPEAMQPMVDAIASTIELRQLQLNDVDLRQWQEVKNACAPRVGFQSGETAGLTFAGLP